MNFSKVIHLSLICLIGLFITTSISAQPNDAEKKIKLFNATLLTVMQNAKDLKFSGRYNTLQPIIGDCFDMDFMAQFSAGKYWRNLSNIQRTKLIEAFEKLWVSIYADRFDGYSGEIFELQESKNAPRGTVLVKTNIIMNDGEKLPIDYLMRQINGSWLVIDIFLKGRFSELAKQRAEYSSVLRREGFDGLMTKVEKKVQLLTNSAP